MTDEYTQELTGYLTTLAEDFNARMRKLGWNTADICRRTSMVYNTVKAVLQGKPATIASYYKVARCLQSPVFDQLEAINRSTGVEGSEADGLTTDTFQEEQESESSTEELDQSSTERED